MTVEEQDSGASFPALVVGGKGCEEGRDFGSVHGGGMSLVVKEDEAPDPSQVGLVRDGRSMAAAPVKPSGRLMGLRRHSFAPIIP